MQVTPFRPLPNRFDVFLSYKSEDANFVRAVADRLIAGGVCVWFAEYMILLSDRGDFQAAINECIRRCNWFVAFTNNRYSHSVHTREGELRQALGQINSENILHIKLPDEPLTHPDFPSLNQLPAANITCADGRTSSVDYIANFVGTHIADQRTASARPSPALAMGERSGHPLERCPAFPMEGYGIYFDLDTGGWQAVGDSQGFVKPGDYIGPMLRRRILNASVALQVGFWPDASSGRVAIADCDLDDRAMYGDLVDFSRRYFDKREIQCHGMHLFFYHGRGHLTLTYWNAKELEWVRRYSILLPHPWQEDINVEVSIHFSVQCDFRKYCNLAHTMDRIAHSVTWRPGTLSESKLQWSRPSLFPSNSDTAHPAPSARREPDGRVSFPGLGFGFRLPHGWCVRDYQGHDPINYLAILSPASKEKPSVGIQRLQPMPFITDLATRVPAGANMHIGQEAISVDGRSAYILTYTRDNNACREAVIRHDGGHLAIRLNTDDLEADAPALRTILTTWRWSKPIRSLV
jgi:hypothetical protein